MSRRHRPAKPGVQDPMGEYRWPYEPGNKPTSTGRHSAYGGENNSGWNAKKTQIRNEVNRWMRTSQTFDALIDFDASMNQLRSRSSAERSRGSGSTKTRCESGRAVASPPAVSWRFGKAARAR